MPSEKSKKLPKLKSLPSTGARRYEQAHAIWNVLSGLVLHKDKATITYGELAELLGYPSKAGITLSEALGIVSTYCLYNDLPPISVLVVEKNSGIPGWLGMIPEGSTYKKEQKKVHKTKWYLFRTPTVGTLRRVREELDWPEL